MKCICRIPLLLTLQPLSLKLWMCALIADSSGADTRIFTNRSILEVSWVETLRGCFLFLGY